MDGITPDLLALQVFTGLALGAIYVLMALVQPAGRTAPIWAYLMRQGASLSWST